ncbi:tellurite resistance protein, putative [Babesia ovis]|uniref:Tellurite resistance protein, putative n=1 Tax=Babesia ovis TaxID=5869 RepID=A0A9W5TD85_BABOV|nr:tellurite resistance protein, putative [Babesia ovis]
MNCLFRSCLPRADSEEAPTRSPTIKDDAYRKEELKQLVGIFASRAQKFLNCTRIFLDTEEFKKARYRLDCQLRVLTFKGEGEPLEIPLTSVKAVYGFEDLQLLTNYEDFLRRDIIQNLSQDDRDRLAIIEYKHDGADCQLIIMEQEIETSDPLITVLRILQMYSMQQQ